MKKLIIISLIIMLIINVCVLPIHGQHKSILNTKANQEHLEEMPDLSANDLIDEETNGEILDEDIDVDESIVKDIDEKTLEESIENNESISENINENEIKDELEFTDSSEESVAVVERKSEMFIQQTDDIERASSQYIFAWIDRKKCTSNGSTVALMNTESPKQQHSYLPCEYMLAENLGVNTYDSNYTDIRLQGGEYAIETKYLQNLNISQIKTVPYYENERGTIKHVFENNPTISNSYWTTKYLGNAPNWMKEGIKYYSFDGIYFTDNISKLGRKDNESYATNKGKPYYDYFQYMPLRSKTNYSATELNSAFEYMYDKSGYASKQTVMKNIGQGLKEAEEKNGVNALMLLAMGIHESAYGTSGYAIERNNLFGINAVDSNPDNATYFNTVADCLKYQGNNLSWSYGDAAYGGFKYYGFSVGTKGMGINVRYASDSIWGESIAAFMYQMDTYLGGKDNNNLNIGLIKQESSIYLNQELSQFSYTYKKSTSSLPNMYPVVLLGEGTKNYKIRVEPADSTSSGKYSWGRYGYITKENIIIATPNNTDIPKENIKVVGEFTFYLNKDNTIKYSKRVTAGKVKEIRKYYGNVVYGQHENKLKIIYFFEGWNNLIQANKYKEDGQFITSVLKFYSGTKYGEHAKNIEKQFFLKENRVVRQVNVYQEKTGILKEVKTFYENTKYGKQNNHVRTHFYLDKNKNIIQANKYKNTVNKVESVLLFYPNTKYGEHVKRIQKQYFLDKNKDVYQMNKYKVKNGIIKEVTKFYPNTKYGKQGDHIQTRYYLDENKNVLQANKFENNTQNLSRIIIFYSGSRYGQHSREIKYNYYVKNNKEIIHVEHLKKGTGEVLARRKFEKGTKYSSDGKHWGNAI